MQMHVPLDAYKKHVDELFESHSSQIITNDLAEHGEVLISSFFRRAQREIVILSYNLKSSYYTTPDVVGAIVDALDRGVMVRILTQRSPMAVGLISELNRFKEAHTELVEIRQCEEQSEGANIPYNFAVMDDKAYRYESDREGIKAIACAHGPTVARKMKFLFEALFEKSTT
jgi:hypothetical protein